MKLALKKFREKFEGKLLMYLMSKKQGTILLLSTYYHMHFATAIKMRDSKISKFTQN